MSNSHQFSAVDNDSIFRYLSYEKFKSLIENSSLFFSRMDLMSDLNEGKLYRSGGDSKSVYGICWRMHDFGNYKDLFINYECEGGVIIKTSLASLRDNFQIFGQYTNCTAWGLNVPYVVFAKVKYTNKIHEEINFEPDDWEIGSQMCQNESVHFHPFLLKKKKYEFEKEMRIFTRWQTMTMSYTAFLPGHAIFETYTGDHIKRSCTCINEILLIEEEIKTGATNDKNFMDLLDQMQPSGFFYPISLNIIESIYTQESSKNRIKKLLDEPKYSSLANKLVIL